MSGRRKLDDEDNDCLTMPITDDEIMKAMFSFEPNKSPRLDGFGAFFYQQAWSSVV